MKPQYSPRFKSEFKKLNSQNKRLVLDALEIFEEDPFNPYLSNHKLEDNMHGVRAISADDNLRIVYKEKNDHAFIIMLRVGTHEDVYNG